MNTLLELNTYSNSQIPFEDDRSLIITTATTDTTTQSVTIPEDSPVDLTTFGVTFSELRSLDDATADNITLRFGFYAANNPIVEWPTKDAFIEGNTKYNNITFVDLGAGTYEAQNIQLNSDYLAVLANTRIIARDQDVPYTYIITVSWPGNSYTQDFDVTTVPSSAETNLNGLSLTARSLFAHLLFDPTLDPTPAITDTAPGNEYELVLTSGQGATLSTTQAGTPTTSVTVTGDRDTANAALSNVYYSPPNGFYNQTDTISYTLTVTNPSIGFPYVSETGSFTNYVPAFAEVLGIVGRSTNSGGEQALFVSPDLPTVSENIGSSVIQLTVSSAQGELYDVNQSLWVSNISFTGDGASLTTDLQGIQYLPPLVLGTNTDTLTYTLTFAGLTLDTGSWLVETSMYFNLNNITTVTSNSSDIVDLFSTPYPVVDETVDRVIAITFNTSTGELKETSVIGSLSNTLTLVGLESGLNSQLPLIQYQAPVLLGTNTDTISYTAVCEGVTLETGTFDVDTTIDTVLANLNASGDTVTDIGSNSMFPVTYNGGVLPSITSTDPNDEYELTLTFGSGTAEINGISNSVTFSSTVSFVESALLAATYRPLVQNTFHNISYEFTLRGVTIQTGQLTKTLPVYFEVQDVPSTVTLPNQRNQDLFDTSTVPLIVDNTTGYNNLEFEMTVSGTATPGVFNLTTNPTTGTVTYTGYETPTGGDTNINTEIADTRYNPHDYITPTTEVITYNLTADGLNWANGSFDVDVPQQIEMTNIGVTRNYTENTKVNAWNLVDTIQLVDLSDLASPSRALFIEFDASNGFVTRNNSAIDVYPYTDPLTLGPAPISQLNPALADTNYPFIYIPIPGSTADETITITIKDTGNTVISTGTVSLQGVARTNPIPGEGLYTAVNPTLSETIDITDEIFLFCEFEALLTGGGGGGGAGTTSGLPAPNFDYLNGGDGGDGGIAKVDYLTLDIFNIGARLTLTPGYSGLKLDEGSTTFNSGGVSKIDYATSIGAVRNDIITVAGGGHGGGSTLDGNAGQYRSAADGGGGGGGFYYSNYGYPGVIGSGGGVIPATFDTNYIPVSAVTEVTDQGDPGLPGNAVAAGGVNTITDDIDGATKTWRSYGGTGQSHLKQPASPTDGDHGRVFVRIRQR